jgi:hypothetical protein
VAAIEGREGVFVNAYSVNKVASPFGVDCPACGVAANRQCVSLSKNPRKRGEFRMKAHPARRKVADEKRTAEVRASEVRK